MKLQITCIWFSLFTLVGISQTGYAAEPMEPQPKETIALIGTGDFGNSFGPRLAAVSVALLGQVYALPLLFGVLSQAMSYRRFR